MGCEWDVFFVDRTAEVIFELPLHHFVLLCLVWKNFCVKVQVTCHIEVREVIIINPRHRVTQPTRWQFLESTSWMNIGREETKV